MLRRRPATCPPKMPAELDVGATSVAFSAAAGPVCGKNLSSPPPMSPDVNRMKFVPPICMPVGYTVSKNCWTSWAGGPPSGSPPHVFWLYEFSSPSCQPQPGAPGVQVGCAIGAVVHVVNASGATAVNVNEPTGSMTPVPVPCTQFVIEPPAVPGS